MSDNAKQLAATIDEHAQVVEKEFRNTLDLLAQDDGGCDQANPLTLAERRMEAYR